MAADDGILGVNGGKCLSITCANRKMMEHWVKGGNSPRVTGGHACNGFTAGPECKTKGSFQM
jgi:hypothetical protein